jgi:signal transduction histidine kinase
MLRRLLPIKKIGLLNKLWVRLSIAFGSVVLIAVLIVVLTGILVRLAEGESRQRNLKIDFLEVPGGLAEELATYYRTRQSWAEVELLLIGAQTIFGVDRDETQAVFLADAQKRVIYHVDNNRIGQSLDHVAPAEVLPIKVADKTVGYLGVTPVSITEPASEGPGLGQLSTLLLSVATVGGVSGIVIGVLMSRTLTAPLSNLAQAARAIGARNLSQRVEVTGSDEMIEVARAFNEMAAALEQAEQLRRNLLADVAHELRTPLTVLQGNLRAILDEVFPLDNAELARLYEHTRLLSRLVNDLHELAQAEARQLSLNLQDTDLAALIRTTTDTFGPIADTNEITLYLELPVGLPAVRVDAARLTQVLQNLLANALRHTPAGGSITVRVEPGTDTISLVIADTGEGIPPEHLPYIFDRFYRTDPARSRDRGGAGLGLAITRAIIEAHNGTVAVASEEKPGRGSTFTIQLPVTRVKDEDQMSDGSGINTAAIT